MHSARTPACAGHGRQAAGQIEKLRAGRQHQEAAVLGDQAQAGGPLPFRPTDPAVARAQMERGTGPAQQGEPSAFGGAGDLAQDLAHEVVVMEGVLRTERLLPAGPFLGRDQAHLDLREPLRFRDRPVGVGGAFSLAGSGARRWEERQKNRSTLCGLIPSRGGRPRRGSTRLGLSTRLGQRLGMTRRARESRSPDSAFRRRDPLTQARRGGRLGNRKPDLPLPSSQAQRAGFPFRPSKAPLYPPIRTTSP
jgi:hypothetical protein